MKFHATRPYLVIATRLHVRIFDLTTQSLRKKIRSNAQWLSCLAVRACACVTVFIVVSAFGFVDRSVCFHRERFLTFLFVGQIHPSGDHILSGSHDRRVCWYDLDRGDLPYKVLRYHTEGKLKKQRFSSD